MKKVLLTALSGLFFLFCNGQSRFSRSDIQKLSAYVKTLEAQDDLEKSGLVQKYAGEKKLLTELERDSLYKFSVQEEAALGMYIRHLEKTDSLHLYQPSEIRKIDTYVKSLEAEKLPLIAKHGNKEIKPGDPQIPASLNHQDTIFSYSDDDVVKLVLYVKALEKYTPPPPPEPVKNPEPVVVVSPPPPAPKEYAEDLVYFSSGSYALDAKAIVELKRMVKKYDKNKDVQFELEGYTDSKGNLKMNRKLSEQRANAVMKYFVKNGYSPSQFKVHFYGPEKPIDTSTTKQSLAKNRRVLIKAIK